jgi:hypothetical protein
LLLVVMVTLFSSSAFSKLGMKISLEPSVKDISNRHIWSYEPEELNPHRRTWALRRRVQLHGLEVLNTGKNQYKVKASHVSAQIYRGVREAGDWAFGADDFPCTRKPTWWYSTREGARVASNEAYEAFSRIFKRRLERLDFNLKKIRADKKELALLQARLKYAEWLEAVRDEYSVRAKKAARAAEWKFYTELAKKNRQCKAWRQKAPAPKGLTRKNLMEAPGSLRDKRLYLARPPALLWDGQFSIRVVLNTYGEQKVSGRFLLDTSAKRSMVSPNFLRRQGVQMAFLPTLDKRKRVKWRGNSFPAKTVILQGAEIGSYPLLQDEFLLVETEVFEPPKHRRVCCDGVLGQDFLRQFAVEFSSDFPAHVKLWPRKKFVWKEEGSRWFEVSTMNDGRIQSGCQLIGRSASRKPLTIPGLLWGTASGDAVRVSKPWGATVKRREWAIRCHGEDTVALVNPKPGGRGLGKKFPGGRVGMGLLSRGPFVLDLANGRMWVSQRLREGSDPYLKTSTELAFRIEEGSRVLKVVKTGKRSPTNPLYRAGLRKGMKIKKINKRDAEKLDTWEVELYLSGRYGNQIEFEWETPKGERQMARLDLE